MLFHQTADRPSLSANEMDAFMVSKQFGRPWSIDARYLTG